MELDDWIGQVPELLRDSPVWKVRAYQIAAFIASEASADAVPLEQRRRFAEVGPQLVRAAGSIAANVAEGYSRRSHRERIKYYEYALGSAREATTWYSVIGPTLAAGMLDQRLTYLARVSQLLLKMIHNERNGLAHNSPRRIA